MLFLQPALCLATKQRSKRNGKTRVACLRCLPVSIFSHQASTGEYHLYSVFWVVVDISEEHASTHKTELRRNKTVSTELVVNMFFFPLSSFFV